MDTEDFFLDKEKLLIRGIDSNLLEGDFKQMEDVISCPICLNILLDPICCKNCSLPMCAKCCKDWMQQNNSCPNRCVKFEEGKLDRLAMKFLSSIKLKCINYNHCNEIVQYDNFLNHLFQCKENPLTCKHCSKEVPRTFLSQHSLNCPEKQILCGKCGILIKRKLLDKHMETAHVEKKLQCNFCGITLKESLMGSHSNICDKAKDYSRCNVCEKYVGVYHDRDNCLSEYKRESKMQVEEASIMAKSLGEKLRVEAYKNENLVHDNADLKKVKAKYGVLKKESITLKYKINELEDELNKLKEKKTGTSSQLPTKQPSSFDFNTNQNLKNNNNLNNLLGNLNKGNRGGNGGRDGNNGTCKNQ